MYYIIYGFLYLLSLLPFPVIYLLSDFIYFLMYYVFGYRKETVIKNLRIAFPEKSDEEIKKISKRVFHNLTDTFIEIIKFISMSDKTFEKRCHGDFSVIEDLINKGKRMCSFMPATSLIGSMVVYLCQKAIKKYHRMPSTCYSLLKTKRWKGYF